MNWLFNLLYWSTFGTKGTWCYAAGRRAQPMPFGAVSAPSLVPRSVHHDWPHSALTQQLKHPEFSWSPAFPTAEGETSSPAKVLMDSGITHSSHAAWVDREDHKSWLFIVFVLYFILLFLFSFSREKKTAKLHKRRQYRTGNENVWGIYMCDRAGSMDARRPAKHFPVFQQYLGWL